MAGFPLPCNVRLLLPVAFRRIGIWRIAACGDLTRAVWPSRHPQKKPPQIALRRFKGIR
jgi:hypothetical protein